MLITLPYPPSTNALYRTIVRGRFAVPIKTKEYRDYQEKVARAFKVTPATPYSPFPRNVPVEVTTTVFRPMRRGDLDNTLKAVLDVLKGVAYEDDDQIVHLEAFRNDDKMNPRVVVRIEAA